jgi:ubiquinone/menaquinone biosynthesis C-methylase UbiE
MTHDDHVRLLREGVLGAGDAWADLGSGDGAFTLALAELLGPSGRIYSVDRDERALARQRRAMQARFPGVAVDYRVGDFTGDLRLPPLDGVVMANSLHFVPDKAPALGRVRACLKPGGRLVLVEYNTDHGNPWVPHPLSPRTWERLATACGFERVRLLATQPSRFLGEIYSALAIAPAEPAPEARG